MKTAEEIKAQIKQLEDELFRAEATAGYLKRIEGECKSTGDKHRWQVDSWEIDQPYLPIYVRRHFSPVDHEPYGRREKAQLHCICGVKLTFEES